MPSQEVWAKLGVDTTSVAADLAKAKQAFTKGGQEIEKAGGVHGGLTGEKLVGGIEHKLTNAKHLSGALAAALGLNIDHIAEGIAAAWVGGTKEAWKQMGDIAEENAKLIEKKIESRLSPKALQEKRKGDLNRAAENAQGADKDTTAEKLIKQVSLTQAFADNLTKVGRLFGIVRSEAEKANEIGEKEHKLLESELALDEQRKAIAESHKKLAEYQADLALKHLKGDELITGLAERRRQAQDEINSGKLSELEIDQKKKEISEFDEKIGAEQLRIADDKIKKEKELIRLQGSLADARAKLASDEENLATQRADRGKLTLDEIAELKPGGSGLQFGESSHVDTFGLNEEAANAKQTANDIKRMQKQAEALRVSGNAAGANALFDQIGAKKQTLVDSGFAKSTEGDQFKQLEQTIHADSAEVQKLIGEVVEVAKGKLRNE